MLLVRLVHTFFESGDQAVNCVIIQKKNNKSGTAPYPPGASACTTKMHKTPCILVSIAGENTS